MKRFSFLPMVVLAALLVAVASCSTPMGASGGAYEEAPVQGNVYYSDPYLGGLNTIIVERDPYTGRYYQVSPGYYGGGGVYAAPAYPYRDRGYRAYGGGGRRYNNQTYNNRNYNTPQGNNGYYRSYPQVQQRQQQQPQQAPVQRPQMQQQRDQAKDMILGPKRRN